MINPEEILKEVEEIRTHHRPCKPEYTTPIAIATPWMRNWLIDFNTVQNFCKKRTCGIPYDPRA